MPDHRTRGKPVCPSSPAHRKVTLQDLDLVASDRDKFARIKMRASRVRGNGGCVDSVEVVGTTARDVLLIKSSERHTQLWDIVDILVGFQVRIRSQAVLPRLSCRMAFYSIPIDRLINRLPTAFRRNGEFSPECFTSTSTEYFKRMRIRGLEVKNKTSSDREHRSRSR